MPTHLLCTVIAVIMGNYNAYNIISYETYMPIDHKITRGER